MSDCVDAVRSFNRFYTGVIGVLREGLLGTPYSLTEARVVFELAARERAGPGELRRALDLDAGYLSRILARFEADGLVTRERVSGDGRRHVVRLSRRGGTVFALLDRRSARQVEALVAPLPAYEQRRLVRAMAAIRELLEGRPAGEPVLRAPEPGDLGWVVERHGALYAA
jgi:DNA-binding MarR family transcriptional regulator